MNVPISQQQVAIDPIAPPDVSIQPITQAASGANIAEAAAGIGNQVEKIGIDLQKHLINQGKIDSDNKVMGAVDSYKNQQQELIYGQDGLVSTYKGVNADQAVYDFDKVTRGVRGQPGKPGTIPLRAQILKGMSEYERGSAEKYFNSIDSVNRGSLIKHASEQRSAAHKVIFDDSLKSQIDIGANVRDAAGIKAAEDMISHTYDNSAYWKAEGHGDEHTAFMKQQAINSMVKNAVEANVQHGWETAKEILDSSSASPDAKASIEKTVINGARIDQYSETLGQAVVSDPRFATATGEIDEIAANKFAEKKVAEEEKKGLPLGSADTITSKVSTQVSVYNRAFEQKKGRAMEKTSNEVWNAFISGAAPDEAYDKLIKNGDFANGIERGKAEDIFKRVYEHDPTALDSVAAHWSPTLRDAFEQVKDSEDVNDKFPTKDDKDRFLNTLKQQIIEKRIQSREGINQLFQDNLKSSPNGAPGWFGYHFGGKTEEYFKTAEELQKNQTLVKAVGGTEAAAALAKNIGGPSKLAPETPESKAVMALIKRGARPDQIMKESIDAVIAKHPDWLDTEK